MCEVSHRFLCESYLLPKIVDGNELKTAMITKAFSERGPKVLGPPQFIHQQVKIYFSMYVFCMDALVIPCVKYSRQGRSQSFSLFKNISKGL